MSQSIPPQPPPIVGRLVPPSASRKHCGLPNWAVWLIVLGVTLFLVGGMVISLAKSDQWEAERAALQYVRVQMGFRGGHVTRSYRDKKDWIVVVRVPDRLGPHDYFDYCIRVQQGRAAWDSSLPENGMIYRY